jgi:hypothetical protein
MMMRWEWDGGFVEVNDGVISGDESFVYRVNLLVKEQFPVYTERYYLLVIPARLDARMNAIATVEWLGRVSNIRFTSQPDISDIMASGIVDGLSLNDSE